MGQARNQAGHCPCRDPLSDSPGSPQAEGRRLAPCHREATLLPPTCPGPFLGRWPGPSLRCGELTGRPCKPAPVRGLVEGSCLGLALHSLCPSFPFFPSLLLSSVARPFCPSGPSTQHGPDVEVAQRISLQGLIFFCLVCIW